MKILIVFGSLLGKTKRIAILIGHLLKESGFNVKVKDVKDTNVAELNDYDVIILGSSTWDDGMLQFDFRSFNNELNENQLNGKNFAIFALGGKRYIHFCTAANILEGTVKRVKGDLLLQSLRLDLDHDEPSDKRDNDVITWVKNLTQILERVSN